jgi:hypothetical protein
MMIAPWSGDQPWRTHLRFVRDRSPLVVPERLVRRYRGHGRRLDRAHADGGADIGTADVETYGDEYAPARGGEAG